MAYQITEQLNQFEIEFTNGANLLEKRLKDSGRLFQVEIDALPKFGFVQITSLGEENLYFTTSNGIRCFCKCL